MQTTITDLYQGKAQPLGPHGKPSAIVKDAVSGPVSITFDGLAGDEQADLVNHGGPDKAVHQYSALEYQQLATAFPALEQQLRPGTMGENFSTPQLCASDVCIGDIWQLGSARLQVSEPRKPCWKINARFEEPALVKFIDSQGLSGWYFRVLEEGSACAGDTFERLSQLNPDWSIARFWQLYRSKTPAITELEAAIALPGLSALWQQKMTDILNKQRG